MKRVIFILLATWGLLQFASAEEIRPQRTPEQEAQRRMEMMSKRLQLNTAQTERVYQIQLKYANLRRKATKREEFVSLMHEMTSELQTVLTQKQFEMYKSWLNGHKNKHPCAFGKPIAPMNEKVDSLVEKENL